MSPVLLLPGLLGSSLPPLVPGPDDARSDLRRELLRPEYHDQDVAQQVLGWIDRRLDSLLDATARAPGLSTVFAMVVLVALLRRPGAAALPRAAHRRCAR